MGSWTWMLRVRLEKLDLSGQLCIISTSQYVLMGASFDFGLQEPPPPPPCPRLKSEQAGIILTGLLPQREDGLFFPPGHQVVFCLTLREWYPGPFGGGEKGRGLLLCGMVTTIIPGENRTWISGEFHHIHWGGGRGSWGWYYEAKEYMETEDSPSHVLELMLKWSPGWAEHGNQTCAGQELDKALLRKNNASLWSLMIIKHTILFFFKHTILFEELSCPLTSLKHYQSWKTTKTSFIVLMVIVWWL